MAPWAGLTTRIIPWEDQDFVKAFERVQAEVAAEGLTINGPRAAGRAEELLRAAGYPHARVHVERTIDEALARSARWTVWRDGPPA